MKRFCFIVMVIVVVSGSLCCAMGQKSSGEQLIADGYMPNCYSSTGKTYYVAQNNSKASDSNPGTAKLPFKTISKAASLAAMCDVILIDEGVYREQVDLLRNGHVYIPRSKITFRAMAGKKVYLKGSDVFDGQWKPLAGGVFKAKLPDKLFATGVYNPYELSCAIDDIKKVRPTPAKILPETLGQIYVDGKALEQLNSEQAVQKKAGSFIVAPDGKELIAHFTNGKDPKGKLVELTVRQRCIKPEFSGTAYMQTFGMVVEHAAEPGPFCYGRPLTIRNNPGTGIIVRKYFALPGNTPMPRNLNTPSYVSKDESTIIASYRTNPVYLLSKDSDEKLRSIAKEYSVTSNDGGKTWQTGEESEFIGYYYFDEEKNLLVNCFENGKYRISSDKGQTWSNTQSYPWSAWNDGIIKLADGSLFMPRILNEGSFWFGVFEPLIGKWRDDLSSIDWEKGNRVEVDAKISNQGLDEAHSCQFADGRIFTIFRQHAVYATQGNPGSPSVKMFSVSEDGGVTWTEPKILTYEDGSYIYSSNAYPDVIRSSKNGRVYVIINTSGPTYGCDPRDNLIIAELDTDSLRVKKDMVAIVDTKHSEHHTMIRFSNWTRMQDRYTKNLLLFMKLSLSEYGPVRNGYDYSLYRYEIEFPD